MVAQVKKYFVKTSDQDWSGVYHNTDPKRTPRDVAGNKRHPDSRDINILSPQEESAIIEEFDNVMYSNPGFMDITREYIDENTLVVSANFETDGAAMTYVYKFDSPEVNPSGNTVAVATVKNSLFEEKRKSDQIPTYDIRVELHFANSEIRRIKPDLAKKLF
jgi:hypothetical protein